MKQQVRLEVLVGGLMVLGLLCFLFIAFKVSGLTSLTSSKGYSVSAEFSDIGDLKVRAPVTIAGVRVGEVKEIILNPQTFYATVVMTIDASQSRIPAIDASARILTEGLLGSNYVSLVPGFEEDEESGSTQNFLTAGSKIQKTQSAVILENLIGKLLFNTKADKG